MINTQLKDQYDRHIDYLRVSITDRCNLQCMYCTPHDLIPKLSHRDILRYEEILRLIRIGVKLGITKVRITGGEPLVRKGVYEFLNNLTSIKGLLDVSLTTNGVCLKDHIEEIKAAGINRINISLDTLRAERYKKITGHDYFDLVWEGINRAEALGMSPIKLNVVALKGVNEDEILDFVKLSITRPFHIRFIEYMTIGDANVPVSKNILTPEIKDRVQSLGELYPIERGHHDGPAECYQFKGAKGQIGFISALSNHFCPLCNRIRLTASGKLRPCLLSDTEVDMKGPMRKGCSDEILGDIFLKAVNGNPKRIKWLPSYRKKSLPQCHPLADKDSKQKARAASVGGYIYSHNS